MSSFSLYKEVVNPNLPNMISVSENSVYFSSAARRKMGIEIGQFFEFLIDRGENAIAVKMYTVRKKNSFAINSTGYCKLRISSVTPRGRYYYQNGLKDMWVFKLEK